jgi:hypothetical protein
MQKVDYIDWINAQNSKLTIIGWFAGLAYYNWFAHDGVVMPWWFHLILIVGGMFAASIVIGGGMAYLAGLIARIRVGKWDAHPEYFKTAGLIATALSFFAAKYALIFAGKYAVTFAGLL